MENNTCEREIDLKEMLFFILRKWRSVIAGALILAILFGAYKIIGDMRAPQQDEGTDPVETAAENVQVSYEEARADYERMSEVYEKSVESLKSEIANREEYMEKSVRMNVDPYNLPYAKADVLVSLDDLDWTEDAKELMTDPTDSLVELYRIKLAAGMDWDRLQKIADIKEEKYVRELIGVSSSGAGNIISLSVCYKDEKTANLMLDDILEQMEENKADLEKSFGSHSITVLNRTSGLMIDTGLADQQKNNQDVITNYNTDLTNRENLANSLVEPEKPQEESTAVEEVAGQPAAGLKKAGIKYIILGGVAGVFLLAVFWGMIYLLSGKLHSESDMRDTLGIPVLGIFTKPVRKRALSAVDEWLEKWVIRPEKLPDDEVIKRAAIQLRTHTGGMKRILVTGTVSLEKLEKVQRQLADSLDVPEFAVGEDMNRSIDTVTMVGTCDAILLVEEKEISAYQKVQKEKELADALQKPIVGCLMY